MAMTITRLAVAATAALVCATAFSASAAARPGAPGCVDIGGTIAADQTCRVHTETSTYTIDMSYPLDYPDQQALSDLLRDDRDDFVDFMAQTRPQDWSYGHELTPHLYRSGTSTSGTQSVVFEMYDDTGALPVTGFKAFNYDLTTGTAITFDTLFNPSAEPVAALDPIVQRFMDNRWKGYGSPATNNTLGARVYQNFAITDDAVIFFIAQGMWLPEVAGLLEVPVPRSEIATLLA
jgi:hypothetical protein